MTVKKEALTVAEVIWTQVKKLSLESWRLPEHWESVLLVVNEAGAIGSEKVTVTAPEQPTPVAPSTGEVETKVGAVMSGVLAVVNPLIWL